METESGKPCSRCSCGNCRSPVRGGRRDAAERIESPERWAVWVVGELARPWAPEYEMHPGSTSLRHSLPCVHASAALSTLLRRRRGEG